jgi:hypothetical protein
MKKQLLFLLLFISTIAFSQTTTTPVGSIKHNNALILNNVADTLLVRNPTTKRIEGISKLVLIDQVKATIVYPATNISIGNRTANTIGVYSSTGTGAILPAVSTTEAGLMPATDKVKLNGIATGATANSTDAQLRDRTLHTGVQAIATVTGLQTALDGKQNNLGFTPYNATNPSGFTANSTDAQLRDRTTHTGVQAIATVTGLQSALDSKQAGGDYATNTTVTNGLNIKINNSEKAVANGVATLGADGKVPNNQIPALAISETFPVSSEAQMIGLSQAEQGDVAIRSDLSKAFILRQSPSSVLANWSELLTPASTVTSVAGKVGAVVLNSGDVGLGNVPNINFTSAVSANTAKITNATHTGDATGSTALTLATVNSNIGTFNNLTVNGKGLVTGASNVTYATGGGTATGTNTGDQNLANYVALNGFQIITGNKTMTGANAFNGTLGATNPSSVVANSVKVDNGSGFSSVDISGSRTSGNLGGLRARASSDTNSFFEILPQGDKLATYFSTGNGVDGVSPKIALLQNGFVGIGTTNPTEKLDVVGNGKFSGKVTATSFFQSSDIRLKNIIKRDGDVIYYTWKDKRDTKSHIGYIAQKVIAKNPDQVNKDDEGYLSVNYIEILVEKIRNLEKEIELLKAK